MSPICAISTLRSTLNPNPNPTGPRTVSTVRGPSLSNLRLFALDSGNAFFSHASAEPGHARIMQALGARPLLHLDMRLGEGTGSALALALLRSACALYNDMASFASAGVSSAGA